MSYRTPLITHRVPSPAVRCVIGVDLGGTNVRAGAFFENGTPAGPAFSNPSRAQSGTDAILDAVQGTINEAKAASVVAPESIGIAIPGHIDDAAGIVRWAPNFGETIGGVFHYWKDVPFRNALGPKVGLPLHMDNDANAAALGEYRFGSGRNTAKCLVMLTVGTGIGGGVVMSPASVVGEARGPLVLVGGNKGGAELGHVVIQANGLVRAVQVELRRVEIDLDAPPADAADAYLRLHLLSHRLAAPRSLNMDGVFAVLPNVVWTSAGPCAVTGFEATRLRLRVAYGFVAVYGVDKFPRMLDYVVPSGVRIGDADRVRLGAHLAVGTTVMHEGFVNYNAGTLGTSMVEGRISAGVVVGADSDLGGGASIMGTLSGGGKEQVSIGERCLLGANAGVGISLGDDCVVEAGLYVTAATKVTGPDGTVVKAAGLSGRSGLLFLRNSVTGTVEVRPRPGGSVELNSALHTHQ